MAEKQKAISDFNKWLHKLLDEAFTYDAKEKPRCYTLQYSGNAFWLWKSHLNRYIRVNDKEVEDRIMSFLMKHNIYVPRIRDNLFDILRAFLRARNGDRPLNVWCPRRHKTDDDYQWIAFQNGVLNLTKYLRDGTVQLMPPSPRWFSDVSVPHDFDPSAKCPLFLKCLNDWLPNDSKAQDFLQEFAGYIFWPDCRYETAVFLEGSGANGKSTFCNAVEYMVGKEQVSNVELTNFNQRFALQPTISKMVNISPETRKKHRGLEVNILKAFISGDRFNVDIKHKDPVEIRNRAKLIVAWNERPKIDDASMGFWRKCRVVKFDQNFLGKKMDIGLADKLRSEAPGMVMWALEGMKRLHKAGKFTKSDNMDATMKEFKEASNPTQSWVEQNLYISEEGGTAKHVIYNKYVDWCEEEGHEPESQIQLGMMIKRILPKRLSGVSHRGGGRSPHYSNVRHKGIKYSLSEKNNDMGDL